MRSALLPPLLLLLAAPTPPPQAPARRVLVGPNVLVSRDGDVPHVESHAASNPADPRNLVAAAITFTRAEGGYACKAYVSTDGGQSWTDVVFPEQTARGSFHPKVAFGPTGTAFHAALVSGQGMLVYRSPDGG